jgi:hypothetical protein
VHAEAFGGSADIAAEVSVRASGEALDELVHLPRQFDKQRLALTNRLIGMTRGRRRSVRETRGGKAELLAQVNEFGGRGWAGGGGFFPVPSDGGAAETTLRWQEPRAKMRRQKHPIRVHPAPADLQNRLPGIFRRELDRPMARMRGRRHGLG